MWSVITCLCVACQRISIIFLCFILCISIWSLTSKGPCISRDILQCIQNCLLPRSCLKLLRTGIIINCWYFLSATFHGTPESPPTHTWLLLDVLFHLLDLQCFMLLHVVELASKGLPRSSRNGSYEVLHYFPCCLPLPKRQLKMVTKLIPVPYCLHSRGDIGEGEGWVWKEEDRKRIRQTWKTMSVRTWSDSV